MTNTEYAFYAIHHNGKPTVLGKQNCYTTFGRAMSQIKQMVQNRNNFIKRVNANNEKQLQEVTLDSCGYKVVKYVAEVEEIINE